MLVFSACNNVLIEWGSVETSSSIWLCPKIGCFCGGAYSAYCVIGFVEDFCVQAMLCIKSGQWWLLQANKNFFQIILSTSQEQDEYLPDLLEDASRASQICLSGFSYRRCNNKSLRDFIATTFSADVLEAYDNLRPLSYKADLGRFCLMHAFGGWYADITLRIISPLLSELPVQGIGFFRDYGLGFLRRFRVHLTLQLHCSALRRGTLP